MSARELKRIERLEAKGRKPSQVRRNVHSAETPARCCIPAPFSPPQQGLALGPQLVDFIHTGKFTSASLPCVLKAQNPHPYTARIMERLEQGSAAAYPASAPQPGALHTLYLRMVHPVSSRLKRARRGSKRRSRHTPTVIDDDEDLGASTDTACSSPKRPTAQQSSPAPHASSKDAGSLAPWTGAHTVPSPDHSVSGEGARPSAKARRKHPEQCSAADALAGMGQPWGGLYSQEDAELAAMLAGAALSDLLG